MLYNMLPCIFDYPQSIPNLSRTQHFPKKMEKEMQAARELLKRMPTSRLGFFLASICKLQPELIEELLEEVDQPLKVSQCEETGREFIICDHNRDGDSFRSPYSNQYQPPCEEGAVLNARLREMEVTANSLFAAYTAAYYGAAVSSVYLWEMDAGFAGAVLIKKTVPEGGWDSIHVFEVEDEGEGYQYTVTTTVMLAVGGNFDGQTLGLTGYVTSQKSSTLTTVKSDADHLENLGDLVQAAENRLRIAIHQVYFGKAFEITAENRSKLSLKAMADQDSMAEALAKVLKGKSEGD